MPFKLHKYKINNNDSQLYIEKTEKEKNKNITRKGIITLKHQ